MKALLGRKIGMSQLFSPDGAVVPVTLIVAEENIVTLRRTSERDGYDAVQLSLPKKEARLRSKATSGEAGSKNQESSIAKLTPRERKRVVAASQEFVLELDDNVTEVGVGQFAVGDVVNVVGVSKGKGFQGVVKRHHFKGGPKSHGHRHVLRRPGSIGSRFPQHVRKGMRMAGRMGADRVTVKNLTVAAVDEEKNLIAIRGAVPGKRGSVVAITLITRS